MNQPKISVVTTLYNRAKSAGQTTISVCSQGYPNLEHIVRYGGSTDGSLTIIERNHDKLTYRIPEPDAGQSDVNNKGFEGAFGVISCWINSDDYPKPGAVASASAA